MSEALMKKRDGIVTPADQIGRDRKIPPPVTFPAVIRVAGVKIHARGKSITSRGQISSPPVTWKPLRLAVVHSPCSLPAGKAAHRRRAIVVVHRVSQPRHHITVTPSNSPLIAGTTATPLDTYSPRQGSSSSPAARTVRPN
jgi:hypothetical protein